MTALGWISVLCAALPAWLFVRNLRAFAPPRTAETRKAVSILIPARDEEANIAAAVEAALENPDAEVLVLEDQSRDRTRQIVSDIAQRDPRVRVLDGAPLPPGWSGKNHACEQLAAAATNDILLFVDADVRLAPDAAARLAQALEAGAALISGVPRQEVVTISEKLLVPLIHFLLLGFLPLERMRRSRNPAFANACGQLIMVKRDAYKQSGGHRAIRASVHDGLALPKRFRAAGFHTDLVDVTELATCRMYRRDGDVWRGLAKNAHEGLGAPARVLPVTLLLGCGQVLPFFFLLTGQWKFAVAAALALLPRLLAARHFHQPPLSVALHPVAILALLGIQWTALIRWLCGAPTIWKRRGYARVTASETAHVHARISILPNEL